MTSWILSGLFFNKRLYLVLALIPLYIFTVHANETLLKQEIFKTPYGEQLPYQIYKPQSSQKKLPLILFLHGAGERGNDNVKQTVHVVPNILKYMKSNNHEAYIIAPQCPNKLRWVNVPWKGEKHKIPEYPSTPLRLCYELLEKTLQTQNIDTNRIYIVGLSMGGFGTWDFIQRKSNLFAAAIPICGGGDTSFGKQLSKLPLWIWHGDQDSVISVSRSRSMNQVIKSYGGTPIYTELAGVGHDAWTPAANHDPLWKWLFDQKKSS